MNKFRFGVLFFLYLLISPFSLDSQIMYSDGASVFISNGALVTCNGGVHIDNISFLINNGNLYINNNSTLPISGSFYITNNSVISGNGNYYIEQDWLNNSIFNADNSSVHLFGNTQQFITSDNGTITVFNNLILTGNGSNDDRKKTLLNVDAHISVNGSLQLNNRELSTSTNSFYVYNPNMNAVTNSNTFGTEGFVSSLDPGYFFRETDSQSDYLFPVGSSDGILRYRPTIIQPQSSSSQTYAVRMNNYSADNDGYFLAQNDNLIDQSNANYYHSIERINGAALANISIYFIPASDGSWTNTAHWNSSDALWKSMGVNNISIVGNYTNISKNNWDFTNAIHPYVLTTELTDIVAILCGELFVPNGFSPNGDAVNDLLEVKVNPDCVIDFSLFIYDRWGEKIFESNNIQKSWNGTYKGEALDNAAFVYFLNITLTNSTSTIFKKGNVSIIK